MEIGRTERKLKSHSSVKTVRFYEKLLDASDRNVKAAIEKNNA